MQDWQETKNGLVKVFKFKNFIEAIDFVNEVAKIAESENHHPEILIHSYNQVKITTISHEEGQITCKDQSLVKLIDKILQVNL